MNVFDCFNDYNVVSGGDDSTIRLWDIREPTKVLDKPLHLYGVAHLNCFNRKLLSICQEGYIFMTSCSDKSLGQSKFLKKINEPCVSTYFDDNYFLYASNTGHITVFNNY